MPAHDQFIDQIIAEEGLDKPPEAEENKETEESQEQTTDDSQQEEQQDTDKTESTEENTEEEADNKESTTEEESADSATETKEEDTQESDDAPSEDLDKAVEESKGYVDQLQKNGYEPYDDKGNLKPFEQILPAGKYLLSKMEAVKVQDKDGKTHEFLTMRDLEEKFPDGFEAKNSTEQMKLQNGIAYNDIQFKTGVKEYNQAKSIYEQETTTLTQQAQSQESIASEYKAMAKQGLVPEVGDPKDPSFKDSDAVKELNKLLGYMDKKNAELQKQGLGQISSLYVAKQLMDNEKTTTQKKDTAKEIDKQRKETASLSRSGSGKDKEAPKKSKPLSSSLSQSNYIEQILVEEGLS